MVDGSGNLLKDDSKAVVPKSGNAMKVPIMAHALVATQLEGCNVNDNGAGYNLLTYLIEIIYFVGYTLSLVAYVYVLVGIMMVTVLFYLLFGTMWRLTFVHSRRLRGHSQRPRGQPTPTATQPTVVQTSGYDSVLLLQRILPALQRCLQHVPRLPLQRVQLQLRR